MKTKIFCFFCLLLLLTYARGQTVAPATHPGTPAQQTRIVEGYGRLPLAFEANQGQTDPQVKFVSRGAGYNLFLTNTEAVLTLHRASRQEPNSPTARALPPQEERSAVLRMKLVGANAKTEVSGQNELPGKSNYFIGNDPKKWHSNVRQYATVRYADVYPGVDLVYYGNQQELEYDFVLQPGANPEQIRLAIRGASKVRLQGGDLVLTSAGGDVRLRSPQIFQEVNGVRHNVCGRYVIKSKNEVGFRVADYDRKRALVIDPALAYSTYLGGSGDDRPFAITFDAAGNTYVTGTTSSPDFPATNPVQPANHGGLDAFVTKINREGTALIYSTYLGGGGDDSGTSIAVDSTGVYVTGDTDSGDFPTRNPIQPTHHWSRDAFVTKINVEGDALVYSTYLGGNNWDTGWGIAVDSFGNAHVRGDTISTDFPVVNAIQPNLRGYVFSCFVAELNADGSALLYSTYWGGNGGEGGVGIGVDAAGNTYVGGYTISTDFPTVNPIQAALAGEQDTFLTKFSADGQQVIYSTYLGGTGDERSEGFTVDSFGNAYTVGYTTSTDFPLANAIQPTNHGGTDSFVAKINAAGNALVYSTYLGGSGEDLATGVAVDSAGNAYISGMTRSTDFPMAYAIQAANHGGRDAFLTKIATDGSMLLFSTYLGGSADEGYWRDVNVAVDWTGNAYVAGLTWSVDFPITPLAFQQSLKGGAEGFVTKVVFGEETTTTLTSSLNPANYGQMVTFTASVTAASGTPTGTVIFYDGSTQLGSATLASGIASISTSSLSADSHSITAAYQGSADFGSSTSAPLNQVVNGVTTTTTLVSTLNPSVFGQAVTFTATVSAASGTPTGTVTFYDGSTAIGSAALANGSASFSVSLLAAGAHSITVAYQGSGAFGSSTSAPLNQVVNTATTTTSLASSVNPIPANQIVTYTVTVTSQYAGAASGTATLQDRGSTIATVPLANNQAAYSTKYKMPGVHEIRATYSGDVSNTGSTSAALVEYIGYFPVASKTVVTTSGSPSFIGQPVMFTATVAPGNLIYGRIPDGELVTFYDGKTTLGSVALASGMAAYTTSALSAKTHTIKATYAGDTIFKSSTGTVTQVVNKYMTTTALSSSPNPSVYGQAITFTATVTPTGPYPLTGKVKFWDGTTGIGTATLSAGVATLTKSKLAVGTHPITAQYLGDSANDKSTSPVVNQVVQ
ncbi:MAG: Ig-like domain repeat protein [Acidobacteriia bacterium]|nr:Ig-like domain repeat protein [Terriglobia bacterium]